MSWIGEWLRTPPGMPSDEQLNRALIAYDRLVQAALTDGLQVDSDTGGRLLHMRAMTLALAVAHNPSPWTPRGWWYRLRIAVAPREEAAR